MMMGGTRLTSGLSTLVTSTGGSSAVSTGSTSGRGGGAEGRDVSGLSTLNMYEISFESRTSQIDSRLQSNKSWGPWDWGTP
jgi:hypothetical protein